MVVTHFNVPSAVRLVLWNETAHWCLDFSRTSPKFWLSPEQKYKALPKHECIDVKGCTRKACQWEKEILFATRYTLTVRIVYKKRWNSFLSLLLASYQGVYVNFEVSRDNFNEREKPFGIFCSQLLWVIRVLVPPTKPKWNVMKALKNPMYFTDFQNWSWVWNLQYSWTTKMRKINKKNFHSRES